MRTGAALMGLALVAACGSEPAAIDAGPCFPKDQATPAGAVELGTAPPEDLSVYRVVQDGDELHLNRGFQTGFHFYLWPVVDGLDVISTDPDQRPLTNFSILDEAGLDLTLSHCPTRASYIAIEDARHRMRDPASVLLHPEHTLDQLVGRTFTARVEVIDLQNRYAASERPFMVLAPLEDIIDAGVPDADISDAGTPDAQVVDAGVPDAQAFR